VWWPATRALFWSPELCFMALTSSFVVAHDCARPVVSFPG
jgi:hypothetical protein